MRRSTIVTLLGVCGLLAATGCGAAQKVEAEVKSNPGMVKGAEDDALVASVKVELGKNAKTKSHNFDVAVSGGVVTLKGSGPADAKAEAESVVKGMPGSPKVVNQITVK